MTQKQMRAVVYEAPGKLAVKTVPLPVLEGNEVLIRTAHAGFCGSDHSLIESGGLAAGYILGHEVSGTVEAVGPKGDESLGGKRVIARPTYCGKCPACSMGKPHMCQGGRRTIGIGDLAGGFAEYFKVLPEMLIPIPEHVDLPSAALAEAYATAYHGICLANKKGGSALVTGGGAIGLAVIQVLRLLKFGPIALSEPMEQKRKLGMEFGAKMAVDPATENLALKTWEFTGGRGFSSVFECSGNPAAYQGAIEAAGLGGSVCLLGMSFSPVTISPLTANLREISITGCYSNTHAENRQVLQWMDRNKINALSLVTHRTDLEGLPRLYEEKIHTGRAVKVMVDIRP